MHSRLLVAGGGTSGWGGGGSGYVRFEKVHLKKGDNMKVRHFSTSLKIMIFKQVSAGAGQKGGQAWTHHGEDSIVEISGSTSKVISTNGILESLGHIRDYTGSNQ